MDLYKEMEKGIIFDMLIEEIKRKNYRLLYRAYEELELYDNRRIINKGKKCKTILPVLTDSIFEIIVSIVIEEICENDNKKMLDLLMDYYGNIFPDVKDAFERKRGDIQGYYLLLKNKVLGTDMVVKNYIFLYYILHSDSSDLATIKRYWKDQQESEKERNLTFETYVQIMERIWKIEGLNENKLYQRYLNKQRQILADYLEIEADAIEEHIVYLSAMTKDDSKKFFTQQKKAFFWMEESLFKVMDKLGISTDSVMFKEIKQYKLIVKENFENLCGALIYYKYIEYAYEEKELSLSMIIRQASIEDVQAFYVALISSFYFELLGKELNKVLESYQQVFSFDKLLGINKEKQLLEKIDKLQTELKDYKDKLRVYSEECFQDKKRQYLTQRIEDREYVEEINQLKKQIENEKNENEKYRVRLEIQEEYIELLEKQEETEIFSADVDISLLSHKKFVFIGGMQGVVTRLRELFPQSFFINDEAVTPPKIIDAVIMFPKFMNHKLYYKYISIARGNSLKVIYCNGTNMDAIKNTIYYKYRESSAE